MNENKGISMAIQYEQAHFEAAYGTAQQLPASTTPEIIFCGRSNVGKSSLINKLLKRKALARTSSQPGKTANINFFNVDGIRFVDLPGYGFAKVSKAERERWSSLISGYFEDNRSFNLVICLVDIRIDAQKLDKDMLAYVIHEELPYVVAFTKADKLTRSKALAARTKLCKALEVPQDKTIITSAETGEGMADLRRCIEEHALS